MICGVRHEQAAVSSPIRLQCTAACLHHCRTPPANSRNRYASLGVEYWLVKGSPPKNLQPASSGHFYGWFLMAHRRGNPGWASGRPAELLLCWSTEFEDEVRRLGLDEGNCADSDQLRQWCERNKNRVYIPESLLKHWRIRVNPNVT